MGATDTNTQRTRAISRIFENTTGKHPRSPQYVAALIDTAKEIWQIDAALAGRVLQEACDVATSIRDAALLAQALTRLGWHQSQRGALGDALTSATRAAHIAETLQNQTLINGATYVLAWLRGRVADFSAAYVLCRKLIDSATLTNDLLLKSRTESMYGLLLKQQGNYEQSIALQQASYTTSCQFGGADRAILANNIAMVLLSALRYTEAASWATRALELCQPDTPLWQSKIQHTLALCHNQAGATQQADAALRQAEALFTQDADDVQFAITLKLDIGRHALEQGATARALIYLERALELAQGGDDLALEARAHAELKRLYTQIGALEQALAHGASQSVAMRHEAVIRSAESAALNQVARRLQMLRPVWDSDLFRAV
jgi:tetratricopeptide (TPR) repeat protein